MTSTNDRQDQGGVHSRAAPTLPQPTGPGADGDGRTSVTGDDVEGGEKAFFITLEARPGREAEVERLLSEIYGHILGEPATGPWFGGRYPPSTFVIFEAFPDKAARDAHVHGRGGDIFRDAARLRELLAAPAHVFRIDVLKAKLETQLPLERA